MNALARFVTERSRLAWLLVLVLIFVLSLAAGESVRLQREAERQTRLATEAERLGIELMSQTLNGNLMGSVAMLGLLDPDIKREALGKLTPNTGRVIEILESVGRSYDADGVFVVGQSGVIASSWDNAGKPSTNLNVKFRPYYQMAMQGLPNIYAAVSLARGDRSLYFSVPIFSETTSGTDAIGAVVARTGLIKVDDLLRDKSDQVLLLSPQGVVFASTHKDWVGHLAGAPTPERLKAIRELKQFGNMFAKDAPPVLPFEVEAGVREYEGRRHLLTVAKVQWNDPFGDWQVVLMEDLDRTVPLGERLAVMGTTAAFLLFIAVLLLSVLRGQHAQLTAARQIDEFSRRQQASAERKAAIAGIAMRLQQVPRIDEQGRVYLSQLHAIMGVAQGALYVIDDDGQLRLAASFACADPPPERLALGEGLLGQCAEARQPKRIDLPPDDPAWRLRSGLGSAVPRCLLMAPVLLSDTLLGAVEVAFAGPPEPDAEETLLETSKLLALNLEILRRSARTEAMLATTALAERASAERAHFQQTLIDTIPYPVFYKGADARFLGVNAAYERTFNVRREELIGRCVLDLTYLPEAERQAYQLEDETTIASVGTIQREKPMPFADGQMHNTLYYVSGFRNADGSPGGLVGTFIDITEQKQAQRNLNRLADAERFNRLAHDREARIVELKEEVNALCEQLGQLPKYESAALASLAREVAELEAADTVARAVTDPSVPVLTDLVDLAELQVLLENFCTAVGIAAAIIDLQGKVLAAARWQRVCTDFHRVNPEACARCVESDTSLALQLDEGANFTVYKCKNGMTDAAAPIVVEGHHLANVFVGQFHSAPPDREFFREQARQFGFDEADYLAAVEAAPVIDEARLPSILSFLAGFARLISALSLDRRRADAAQREMSAQAEQLRQERLAAMSLAEDAEQARASAKEVQS